MDLTSAVWIRDFSNKGWAKRMSILFINYGRPSVLIVLPKIAFQYIPSKGGIEKAPGLTGG